MLASGFEAEGLELGCGEEGCDVLVARGGAAAVQFVIGEKIHVRVNFTLQCCARRCCLFGCCVERVGLLPPRHGTNEQCACKRCQAQAVQAFR
jgi:hypothetical protein